MTIEEAETILGVNIADDERMIKMRFRRLMSKYHPDVVQSDHPRHLKKAQLINEAYGVLQKNSAQRKKIRQEEKKPVWNGTIIPQAFRERTIYMLDGIWEEAEQYYFAVVKGRYAWDPDLEEFSCLIHSLNEVAMELLEEAEKQIGIYALSEWEQNELRFPYQVKLFHLLARQFINPLHCLKKLANAIKVDEQGREIYCFEALLKTQGEKLSTGSLIYVAALTKNRIMMRDGEGNSLGHLSFQEDSLYYVIIPILQKKNAQVKCVVKQNGNRKSKAHFYLRLKQEIEEERPANLNLQIAEVLNEYDVALKKW